MNPNTKILVVEDEIALCQSLKLIIQTLGVTVIDVINGTQALEALIEHEVKIILCDINLPDISGYEILKQVKASPNLSEIPFILLVGPPIIKACYRAFPSLRQRNQQKGEVIE